MKLWHMWAHRLHADGKSVVEISHILRKPDSGVRYTLNINGYRDLTKEHSKDHYKATKNKTLTPHPMVWNNGRRWDSRTIRKVCAAKGRKTARQLADELGVTRNTVIGIWDRHHDRPQTAVRL